MDTLLQKVMDKDIPSHEAISGLGLYIYTGSPSPDQMALKWQVPITDIHQLSYVIFRANNREQAMMLFQYIFYLVEAGIYTNLSHVKTKLEQI